MPKAFTFVDADVQLWLPLTLTARDRGMLHANNWADLGRLKPGAIVAQAQAQIDAANVASLASHPESGSERFTVHAKAGHTGNKWVTFGG
jgi:hypothetical protein